VNEHNHRNDYDKRKNVLKDKLKKRHLRKFISEQLGLIDYF
jgi:hypothetical protein